MEHPTSHYLCPVCIELEDVEDYLDLAEVTASVPEVCEGCGDPFTGKGYRIAGITLPPTTVQQLQEQIEECGEDGCGRVADREDDGYILDNTNRILHEMLQDLAIDGAIDGDAGRIIGDLINAGSWELIEVPHLECPNCGLQIDSWHAEVAVESPIRVIRTPALPDDVRAMPALRPPGKIEYYRSDCSRFLVHLTRANRVPAVYVSNLTDAPIAGDLSASEILWLMLRDHLLLAAKGKGMYGPAVCFTEKPLSAIKDTLLGHEFSVRNASKVLTWAPYGLMFSKEYLQSKGVAPVICAARQPPGVDSSLFVRLDDAANWLHEREWRCPQNLDFDTREAIVLVPHFAQVDRFRALLDEAEIPVRGILPLYDLFAWC